MLRHRLPQSPVARNKLSALETRSLPRPPTWWRGFRLHHRQRELCLARCNCFPELFCWDIQIVQQVTGFGQVLPSKYLGDPSRRFFAHGVDFVSSPSIGLGRWVILRSPTRVINRRDGRCTVFHAAGQSIGCGIFQRNINSVNRVVRQFYSFRVSQLLNS